VSKTVPSEKDQSLDVTINVNRKPACRVDLEVKASPSLVATARKNAIKKVGKEVSFPGFRKGRAPEEIVVKKYPEAIESEWHKSIADAAFAAAQMQARIPVLNNGANITFDLNKHSLEEGAELRFSFETEPELPKVDPKQFHPTPVKKAEVGEKQIDEAVRQMRFFYAKWTPLEGRGIQEGDYIQIDLDTIDTDQPQKVFNQIRFEVSQARMANWMKALVIGAKAGDVLEGLSEADEDGTEEDKKEFTPKKVRLTIHHAEEATLPNLDDEFTKKVGAENLAALRESVKSILDRNAEDKVQSELREQINDFLVKTYAFELPLSLIDTERNHRKSHFLKDPQSAASYAKLSDEEKHKIDEKIYNESSQAVRLFYLTRHIVRDAEVPVTHGEVQQEAVSSASALGQKVDPDKLPKEAFALALSKVIMAKAQNYILENYKKEEKAAIEKKPEA
jgi:trigger factor